MPCSSLEDENLPKAAQVSSLGLDSHGSHRVWSVCFTHIESDAYSQGTLVLAVEIKLISNLTLCTLDPSFENCKTIILILVYDVFTKHSHVHAGELEVTWTKFLSGGVLAVKIYVGFFNECTVIPYACWQCQMRKSRHRLQSQRQQQKFAHMHSVSSKIFQPIWSLSFPDGPLSKPGDSPVPEGSSTSLVGPDARLQSCMWVCKWQIHVRNTIIYIYICVHVIFNLWVIWLYYQ